MKLTRVWTYLLVSLLIVLQSIDIQRATKFEKPRATAVLGKEIKGESSGMGNGLGNLSSIQRGGYVAGYSEACSPGKRGKWKRVVRDKICWIAVTVS